MPLNVQDGMLVQGQVFQTVMIDCNWLSGGNEMAFSGKQAFVGRRERTNLKTTVGEVLEDFQKLFKNF